jgi:hypothetical protein
LSRQSRPEIKRLEEEVARLQGELNVSRISELFSRDILDKPYTDEELAEIIAYLKGVRAKWEADNAAAIAGGLPALSLELDQETALGGEAGG